MVGLMLTNLPSRICLAVSRSMSGEDGLYDRLDTALDEISQLARDIRENPDRYINLRIF